MSQPNPYQVGAFVQAARDRSFSRAAQSLGVTQSSVTQHVSKLEKTMGAQLFVRRRDGLELTNAGRELFEVADRWASVQNLVYERITNYTSLEEGHLRIIATTPRPAMPLIAKFINLYPNVLIDFSLKNQMENMIAIRDRDVDIAICTDPTLNDGVFAQEIERVGFRLFVRSDHRLAAKDSVSLADLEDETMVTTEDGSLTQRVLKNAMDNRGLSFKRTVKMATYAVVKEAILHGMGIGLLLEKSVHESRNLKSLMVQEISDTYTNYVVIPRDKENLKTIKCFLDLI